MPAPCTVRLERVLHLAPGELGRASFPDTELGLGGFHWRVTGIEVIEGRASLVRAFLLVSEAKTVCVVQVIAPRRIGSQRERVRVQLVAELEGS